jgi:hypothetical protein
MHYCFEKVTEHRLEQATREYRNAGFVRDLRAFERVNSRGALSSLRCRLATWLPLLTCPPQASQSYPCATASSEIQGRWQW